MSLAGRTLGPGGLEPADLAGPKANKRRPGCQAPAERASQAAAQAEAAPARGPDSLQLAPLGTVALFVLAAQAAHFGPDISAGPDGVEPQGAAAWATGPQAKPLGQLLSRFECGVVADMSWAAIQVFAVGLFNAE